MFQHNNTMCCSTCFEEMIPLIFNNDKPITYICINCGKIADIFDEL